MRTDGITLYHAPDSPNSRRVRMFLAEKGLRPALISVDLDAGEQQSAAYREINPRQVVPTLVIEDGTAIGEVLAIWRYIEETHPDPPLLGRDPRDRALVTMWERWVELDGFLAAIEGVRHGAPGFAGRAIAGPYQYEQIARLVLQSRQRLQRFYVDLELRLSEVSFVAGDRFSAADITALSTVDYAAGSFRFPYDRRLRTLRRWHEKLSLRLSAKA